MGGLGIAEYAKQNDKQILKTSNVEEIENAILLSTFPEVGTDMREMLFRRFLKRLSLRDMDLIAMDMLSLQWVRLILS